ncbi:MAG: CDP-glucose 4,6-dehydratase [Verrucomicrobia bacterium]|nr:CDP-glucose 4,6-dehydratase [Verrucomicrobiota bacterium]
MNSKLELNTAFGGVYAGKRVLLTGHTGFKGAWLAEWLLALGAEVTGFALPPPTTPSLFEQLGLASRLRHVEGDVRDLSAVRRVVEETKPDFVFHLAAQPLVRLSYEQPTETFAINVMGTANVLEALRCYQNEFNAGASVQGASSGSSNAGTGTGDLNSSRSPRSVVAVMITTDKCYENKEWVHSYREEDSMGGYDPYSASKGAAELVIASYRRSYFSVPDSPVKLASARAGNVIGGGDWALDRIVPDCMRALARGEIIPVRNKIATRPWQHVLEPLSGYLLLASELARAVQGASSGSSSENTGAGTGDLNHTDTERLKALSSAFNFGPALTSNRTVAELVQEILRHWPGRWEDKSDPRAVHEAKLLNLATDKAHHFLRWKPVWNFEQTIEHTVMWYRQVAASAALVPALTAKHIADYTAAARLQGIAWAQY